VLIYLLRPSDVRSTRRQERAGEGMWNLEMEGLEMEGLESGEAPAESKFADWWKGDDAPLFSPCASFSNALTRRGREHQLPVGKWKEALV